GEVLALLLAAALLVDRARPEGVVELLRRPSAGMQRAGNELPERLEVLEHRPVRIIVIRRRVMHVGRDPDRVANAGMLDEGKQIGDLDLAAAWWAVALPDRVLGDHAERQIGG